MVDKTICNSQLNTEASMPLVKTRELKVMVLQLRTANCKLRIGDAWTALEPGQKIDILITTLLDTKTYPVLEIVKLYDER